MKSSPLVLSWMGQLVVAVVLLQTLFFKFTGAPESVHIFSRLGVEPWGRIGTGVLELVAAVLIMIPATAVLGAALAAALMLGAIFSHLTVLGIVVMDDGGLLFGLACLALVASLVVLTVRRDQVTGLLALAGIAR